MSASAGRVGHLFKHLRIPPSLHSTAGNSSGRTSRLFRIRRSVLPPLFSFRQPNQRSWHCPHFSLYTSRLSKDVIDSINNGPSWLRGAYSAGTLSGKHEKYRLINYAELKTWREEEEGGRTGGQQSGSGNEKEDNDWEKARLHLVLTKIPILHAGNPNNDRVPSVILCTKKKVHKDANKRRQAANKLWTALQFAVSDLQGTSQELPKDPETALVLLASKEAITATPDVLAAEMKKAVSTLFSKAKASLANKAPYQPKSGFSKARQS